MNLHACTFYHHTCTYSSDLLSLAQYRNFSQQLQIMISSLQLHLIQPYLNKHENCLPFMTDHVTLLQTNLSLLCFFVCGVIPVTTVIIFITVLCGYFSPLLFIFVTSNSINIEPPLTLTWQNEIWSVFWQRDMHDHCISENNHMNELPD